MTNIVSKPRIVLRDGALNGVLKDLGISRAELSRRMRIDSKTAWRIEMGQNDPSPAFIASLILISDREFGDLFRVVLEDAA